MVYRLSQDQYYLFYHKVLLKVHNLYLGVRMQTFIVDVGKCMLDGDVHD